MSTVRIHKNIYTHTEQSILELISWMSQKKQNVVLASSIASQHPNSAAPKTTLNFSTPEHCLQRCTHTHTQSGQTDTQTSLMRWWCFAWAGSLKCCACQGEHTDDEDDDNNDDVEIHRTSPSIHAWNTLPECYVRVRRTEQTNDSATKQRQTASLRCSENFQRVYTTPQRLHTIRNIFARRIVRVFACVMYLSMCRWAGETLWTDERACKSVNNSLT